LKFIEFWYIIIIKLIKKLEKTNFKNLSILLLNFFLNQKHILNFLDFCKCYIIIESSQKVLFNNLKKKPQIKINKKNISSS